MIGREAAAVDARRGGHPYPGVHQDAGTRHAESWPRHKAKARNRHRARSSLRRGKQTTTETN